jgi:uncharacterized protein
MTNAENKKSPLPWYKEGLNFKCTECGKCCTGPPAYVFVTKEEIVKIADHLQMPFDLFVRRYVRKRDNRLALIEIKSLEHPDDRDCVFLKDKKCLIYQVRPKQCRTFPWWPENLNTPESWKLAAKECEGISDDAPLVPYEDIVKALHDQEAD